MVNNAGIPAVTAQDAIPSTDGFFRAQTARHGTAR